MKYGGGGIHGRLLHLQEYRKRVYFKYSDAPECIASVHWSFVYNSFIPFHHQFHFGDLFRWESSYVDRDDGQFYKNWWRIDDVPERVEVVHNP